MPRMLGERHETIDYIGRRGAFPVLDRATGEPAIKRPGDDESQAVRVAWPAFFDAMEQRGYALVVEDTPELAYRFEPKRRAMRELHLTRMDLARHAMEWRGFPWMHPRHA